MGEWTDQDREDVARVTAYVERLETERDRLRDAVGGVRSLIETNQTGVVSATALRTILAIAERPKERAMPTWVNGIGPPLEQIYEDYDQDYEANKDVRALINEIYRLRKELKRISRAHATAEHLQRIADDALRPEGKS